MIKRLVQLAAATGAAILAMAVASNAAWAEKRVALIVGNSSYQTVPQLPNPSRDATSVAKMFRDAGFDSVDVQLNVGNLEFKRAIRKFETTADQADIAVVYYAGHGLEIGGTNYLIPTDARLASDRDADDEAILLERLVSSADGAKRLRLVILDACRDNPFTTSMRRERKVANRGVAAGLGKVEPTSTDTLIAYAAKAGSTADDGDGQHSPFTTAILKNLTVPGLDVRLAFGRVRDEVLKITSRRQEPFVYGSLGGGNIALVPAPAVSQDVPVSDIKADYDLVQKIGSKRAWEVFLGTHPTGFYADLARAQIETLNNQPDQAKVNLAALPQPPVPSREMPTKESLEWDRVKDATDPVLLQRFIKRYPDSPLAISAQQRVEVLKKAAQEREEHARAEREAVRKAAEEAQRLVDQRKAELAAAKKREDDERRAREAEAAEKARAAAAEMAAAKKRSEEERRAKALEAEQKSKAAEAERKAAEAQLKAEQAARDKSTAEAAALKAASEKQAREAEEARKKAEFASAKEAACKSEQARIDELTAKGSEGSGIDDLKAFARTVTCDRLGGLVSATLDKFRTEAAKRAAAIPNSPELVRSAQTELIRLGCLTGKSDGALNAQTNAALGRYMSIVGQPAEKVSVSEALVAELNKHATRVCPIECKTGETLKGETCVPDEKPQAAPATASRKDSDEDDTAARRKRQPEREKARARPAPEPAPRARQQAVARPSIVSGGGGHSVMTGVGF
ncbi:MAG: caspase family protein [Bradyrhizobium sp.]